MVRENINNTSVLLHHSTNQSANLNDIISICHTFRCRVELFPTTFQYKIQFDLSHKIIYSLLTVSKLCAKGMTPAVEMASC